MTEKITQLTKAQEAMLPVWRDKWIEIGLSCEPCDFEKSKIAAAEAYRAAGLGPPKHFFLFDSPVSAAIGASVLKTAHNASVWASVRASVRDSVWDSVWASVWDSVRDSVWASVGASVRASVGDSVRDSVGDSVWASVGEQRWGSHEANWLAFIDYFREVCGLRDITAPLLGLTNLASHCGWWAPYSSTAIFQHRHCELHRDTRGRLHNPSGMAVKYRDGWGLYRWHGINVAPWIIEQPQLITPQKIESETNAEVRRVLIERFGFDRFIVEGGLKLVQQDDFGKLYKREYSDNEPAVALVEVVNSTPEPDGTFKKYVLPVRSAVRSAHEAVASSFNLTVKEYAPIQET